MMLCAFLKKRRLRKRFAKKLKQRTEAEWRQSWRGGVREANVICRVFAWYLKLPNYYLFPDDDLHEILLFETGQMEDIEALLMIDSCIGKKLEDINGIQKLRDFLDRCPVYAQF